MAGITLSSLSSLPDPALSTQWWIPILPFDTNGEMHKRILSVNVSFENIGEGEPEYSAGGYYYYAGTTQVEAFSIVFREDELCTSMKYVYGWKSRVRNPNTGLVYLPSWYKKDVVVELLNSVKNPIQRVTYKGVYPSTTSQYALSGETATALRVEQQFRCDSIEQVFLV